MKTVYITRNELFKDLPLVLCNNITQADESFIQDNFNLFYRECEECEGTGEIKDKKCDECYGEGAHDMEIYQYFITSANYLKIQELREYGVELGYSELLDVHILPIYDFGTGWSAFSYSKEVDDDYQLSHNETLTRSTPY